MIRWNVSKTEQDFIERIVKRAHAETPIGEVQDETTTMMDITACHRNGNELHLEKMLSMPHFDFVHDIYGIRRHLNRRTGELEDFFSPRASRCYHEVHA